MISINKLVIRVLNKIKILPYFNLQVKYKHAGQIFKIPLIQNVGVGIIRIDFANTWLIDLLRKLRGDASELTIIDIGVNLGQTLIGIKTLTRTGIKYIGFEPNPVCIYYLGKLIACNNFDDCEIVPTALSNNNSAISFIASSDTDDAGSIVKELRPDKHQKKKQYVCSLRFDDLEFSTVNTNFVVKIDVEGAELDVIKGMQNFMKAKYPPIICEVLHAHSAEQLAFCEKRNTELLTILKTLEYEIYRIVKNDDGCEVTGFEKIVEFDKLVYSRNSGLLCDYLFLPNNISLPAVNQST